ncbi:MAG: hypothetical protein IJ647_01715 [Prevotella sp.]|nr:hypothetical protein [Prevotella sp.]
MKNTMKRNTLSILLLTCLLALGAMQAWAVNYGTNYRKPTPFSSTHRMATGRSYQSTGTDMTTTFHSTSAYSSALSSQETANPMLNTDGSVNESNYIGRPRRVIVTPDDGDDGDEPDEGEGGGDNKEGEGGDHNWNGSDQPLGDVLLPLTLLACAYAIYKVSRRRKEA